MSRSIRLLAVMAVNFALVFSTLPAIALDASQAVGNKSPKTSLRQSQKANSKEATSAEKLQKIIDGIVAIESSGDKFTSPEEQRLKIENLFARVLGQSKTLKLEFQSRPGDWLPPVYTTGSPWMASTYHIKFDKPRSHLLVPPSLDKEPLGRTEPPFNWNLIPGQTLPRYATVPVVPVWRVERKVQTYVAQNSFGAKVDVESSERSIWGILIADEIQREYLSGENVFAESELQSDDARKVVGRLIWRIEVEPMQSPRFNSQVVTVNYGKTATIDHPFETRNTHRYLTVTLRDLKILDPKSGTVLFSYPLPLAALGTANAASNSAIEGNPGR